MLVLEQSSRSAVGSRSLGQLSLGPSSVLSLLARTQPGVCTATVMERAASTGVYSPTTPPVFPGGLPEVKGERLYRFGPEVRHFLPW